MLHLYGKILFSGGETIREINRQSGAHCELSRDPPPNQHERVFRIQGNPEQVQSAIRLINEKTGQVIGILVFVKKFYFVFNFLFYVCCQENVSACLHEWQK